MSNSVPHRVDVDISPETSVGGNFVPSPSSMNQDDSDSWLIKECEFLADSLTAHFNHQQITIQTLQLEAVKHSEEIVQLRGENEELRTHLNTIRIEHIEALEELKNAKTQLIVERAGSPLQTRQPQCTSCGQPETNLPTRQLRIQVPVTSKYPWSSPAAPSLVLGNHNMNLRRTSSSSTASCESGLTHGSSSGSESPSLMTPPALPEHLSYGKQLVASDMLARLMETN